MCLPSTVWFKVVDTTKYRWQRITLMNWVKLARIENISKLMWPLIWENGEIRCHKKANEESNYMIYIICCNFSWTSWLSFTIVICLWFRDLKITFLLIVFQNLIFLTTVELDYTQWMLTSWPVINTKDISALAWP